MTSALRIEGLSKRYRLGLIGGTTLRDDLARLYARLRGRPDPLTSVLLSGAGNVSQQGKFVWALRDVDLEFEEGRATGIVGHNGAGKTTLLKILSRITAPTTGWIGIRGRVASLLEVGTGFHPELTGRENIFLNGAILGMTKSEVASKLDEIVDFSGVEPFIDTPVKRYSSGMRVRLAFAVAAHLDPEILLIDEVLSVGDAAFQKKCLGKMEQVTRTGRTVLFVSHQMAMVRAFCERTILIEKGRVAADGATDQVLLRYLGEAAAEDRAQRVSLEASEHRQEGSGVLRFVDWSISDPVLGPGTRARCGEPCDFHLRYRGRDGESLRNVSVALVIKDSYGRPLVTGWTHLRNEDFREIPAEGTFVLRLGHLPLVPDTYLIHLWCAVNSEVADMISNAGHFEIIPSDVFGTGRLPNKVNHGEVILKQQSWRLSSDR